MTWVRFHIKGHGTLSNQGNIFKPVKIQVEIITKMLKESENHKDYKADLVLLEHCLAIVTQGKPDFMDRRDPIGPLIGSVSKFWKEKAEM